MAERNSSRSSINNSGRSSYFLQEQEGNRFTTEIQKLPELDAEAMFNLGGSKADEAKIDIADREAKVKALENQKKAALISSSLQSLTDVMASETQYEAIKGAAATNIYLMNHQKSMVMAAGKQAALDRQMEGELNADKASLSLAAQGQDLGGAGADKVTSSYRAMGIMNAAREEAKMYAEMAGYDIQIANEDYGVEMAGLQNDMALTQGILNVGMSAGGYFAK